MAVAIPALLAALYAWAVFASTFWRPGAIGLNYNAPGSDWMVLYSAAHLALSGHMPLIFDGDRFTAYLNASLGHWLTAPLQFRPWVYPPSFLVMLAPLEPLGFAGSYAAFQFISAGLLAAALLYRADQPRVAPWLALAVLISPAASINAVDGQCSFLVAALLVAGFRLLGPRPLLAGAVLGVLTFKPQFWILVPVALAAAGQWRSLAAAILSAGVLAAISAAIFGLESWVWWIRETLQSYSSADPKWVSLGRIWGNSVYTCAVLLGIPAKLASLIQTGAILASAAAVVATFRTRLAPDLKLAVLLVAAILAAPHSAAYDVVLLVVAAGLWLASEPTPPAMWRWILALAFWLSALFSPPVLMPTGRFIPLLLVGFIGLVLYSARAGMRLDAARNTP
ncbi:MAG: DUF2029 domain-containing protein [Phenylobacterium sp.]|nr:MAG: DUF2029 domain-containing protein [Phenylobacterium sp.]